MLYSGDIAPLRSGGVRIITESSSDVRVLLVATGIQGNAHVVNRRGYRFRGQSNSAGCLANARRKPNTVLAWPGALGAT